jgi:hypothetical protein
VHLLPALFHERVERLSQGLQVGSHLFLAHQKGLLNTCLFCSWFVNLSTSAGFFTWLSINVTYLRFCAFFFSPPLFSTLMTKIRSGRGHKVQGIDRSKLAYWSALQPGLAIWGTFWTTLFVLIDGYQVFFQWNSQDFLTAYINIPLFFALWIGWSLYMRRPFWRAHEMDFVTVRLSSCTPLHVCLDLLTCAVFRRAFQPSRRRTVRRNLLATSRKRSSTRCSNFPDFPGVSPTR